MSDRGSFLRRVDERLPLLAEQRAPVIEELESHLDEAVANLVVDGWDPAAAEEEALRRMGDPEELARDLGRAQQTRKRLLAAAGAGVMSLTGSLWIAFAFGVVAVVPTTLLLGPLLSLLHHEPQHQGFGSDRGFVTVVLLWMVAWIAGRRLPVPISHAARRPIAWGKRVTILVLVPFAAIWVVAIAEAEHSPLSVMLFVATPAIAWLGARKSDERGGWSATFRAAIPPLVVLLVIGGLLDAWGPPAGGTRIDARARASGAAGPASLNLGLVGLLDDAPDPGYGPNLHLRTDQAGIDVALRPSERVARRYPTLSAELWPAAPDLATIDPRALGPLARVDLRRGTAMEPQQVTLILGWHVEVQRQARWTSHPGLQSVGELTLAKRLDWGEGTAWVVLVGTDPGGERHVLSWAPVRQRLAFHGSILDWLTADRSPAPIATT